MSSLAFATCSISALPFNLTNGTTADATQVMADFNQIFNGVNAGCAAAGANTDITSLLGTTTGLARTSGQVGELKNITVLSTNSTVTFTNASANISWAANTPVVGQTVYFTSTGGLPTNFAINTDYYVVSVAAPLITVSATYGGTAIVAGSAGTGTQTGWNGAWLPAGTVTKDIAALTLTPGDWTCSANSSLYLNGSTSAEGDFQSSINLLSSNTLTTPGNEAYINPGVPFTAGASSPMAYSIGEIDVNSASTTNVFLNANQNYQGSAATAGAVGSLRCRRVS